MMFLLDIAVAVEVVALISGVLLLILIEKIAPKNSAFLKLIAYFAMLVAIGGMSCSIYYGFKYRNEGVFDRPSQMRMDCPMMDKNRR